MTPGLATGFCEEDSGGLAAVDEATFHVPEQFGVLRLIMETAK
jgi:hypothetical protein